MRAAPLALAAAALAAAAPALAQDARACPEVTAAIDQVRRAREELSRLAAERPPDALASEHDRETLRELSRGFPVRVEDASPAPGLELSAGVRARPTADAPREDLDAELALGIRETFELSVGGRAGIRDGEAEAGPAEVGAMLRVLRAHGLRPDVALAANAEAGPDRSARGALLVTEERGLTRVHANVGWAWREDARARLDAAVGADRVVGPRLLVLADAWGETASGDEAAAAGGEVGVAALLSASVVLQGSVGLAGRGGRAEPTLFVGAVAVF